MLASPNLLTLAGSMRIPVFRSTRASATPLTTSLVRPRVVILLGSTAAKAFFGPQARITAIRGKWFRKDDIYWMPTFHPAALLRDETKKRPVWEDLKAVRRMLDRMAANEGRKEAPDGGKDKT